MHRGYAIFLFLFLIAPPGYTADRPVPAAPEEQAVARAKKLIAGVYKDQYAAAVAPAQRLALAEQLLKEAGQTADDPAARYVLLCEARDLASHAGDAIVTCRAIEMLHRHYNAGGPAATLDALQQAARVAATADQTAAIAQSALAAADVAIAADQYELADRLCALASAEAVKSRKIPLIQQVQARQKDVQFAVQQYQQSLKALESIRNGGDDPAQKSAAGQFLCFYKGQWDQGLRLLADGAEGPYKTTAGKDLASPSDAPAQADLAAEWWDLADKQSGRPQAQMRKRSQYWYLKCAEKLTGLHRTVALRRLDELEQAQMRDLRLEPGLSGEYHAVATFTKPVYQRIDPTIDFEWSAAPADGMPKDGFSVRWTGSLKAPAAGQYALTIIANTGARVFIDDKQVLEDTDGTRRKKGKSAEVDLAEGLHPLRVEFWDGGGLARIRLLWQPPGTTEETPIPAKCLWHEQR